MHSTLWLSILVGYILGAVAAALVLPPAAIEAVALPVGMVACMLVATAAVAVAVERTRSAAMELADFATAPVAVTGGAPTRPGGLRFEWEPPVAHRSGAAVAWTALPPAAGASAAAWTAVRPIVVRVVGPESEVAGPPAGDEAVRARPPIAVAAEQDAGETLSAEAVRRAVDLGRIEVFARPIVTLPQRRVAAYEGLTRLRDPSRGLVPSGRCAAAAERAGLSGRMDLAQLRAWARFVARETGAGRRRPRLFWRLSPASLGDPDFVGEAVRFLAGRPALARRLVLAPSGAGLDGAAWPALRDLCGPGAQICLDLPQPAEPDAPELACRGVAFVRLDVGRFEAAADPSRLDPELVGLIEGFRAVAIEPIVTRIGSERTLLEVLDYRVRYGQGGLFGAPEPLAG